MTNSLGSVVIVGVLDVLGSTNLYMAKAFMRAGYDVIPVNYRTIVGTYGPKTLDKVLHRIALNKPKLMLFSKCNGISSEILGRCSLSTKTWLWFMDGLGTLSAIPEIIDHMSMTDYASCTGLGVANEIRRKTDMEVFHIMEGIDPETYRPTAPVEEYKADISFIGTTSPERTHYINSLGKNGYVTKAYGNGYGDEVTGNIFNMVCSSSTMMLAISAEHNTPEYFSDRIFRYGACGSFVVHKYSPNMEKYFEDGKDLVYFHDEASMLEVVSRWATIEATATRREIANNLYQKVLQQHTWDTVIEKILSKAEIQ